MNFVHHLCLFYSRYLGNCCKPQKSCKVFGFCLRESILGSSRQANLHALPNISSTLATNALVRRYNCYITKTQSPTSLSGCAHRSDSTDILMPIGGMYAITSRRQVHIKQMFVEDSPQSLLQRPIRQGTRRSCCAIPGHHHS